METLLNDQPHDADWQKLRPVLDEVLSEIDERDRDAILLRFFDGRPFAEIGERLRLTENAARMRVERRASPRVTTCAGCSRSYPISSPVARRSRRPSTRISPTTSRPGNFRRWAGDRGSRPYFTSRTRRFRESSVTTKSLSTP